MGVNHAQRDWANDPFAIAALSACLSLRCTFDQCARIFRCSRSAIAGAKRRHVARVSDPRSVGDGDLWTERRLTEKRHG